jgi:hypothetical protein
MTTSTIAAIARGTFRSTGTKIREKIAQTHPARASRHLSLLKAKAPPTIATIALAITITDTAAKIPP